MNWSVEIALQAVKVGYFILDFWGHRLAGRRLSGRQVTRVRFPMAPLCVHSLAAERLLDMQEIAGSIPAGRTMRDPNRIDRILETIREYWKKNPDLRLSQIIHNADVRDLHFHLEDDELEKEIRKTLMGS